MACVKKKEESEKIWCIARALYLITAELLVSVRPHLTGFTFLNPEATQPQQHPFEFSIFTDIFSPLFVRVLEFKRTSQQQNRILNFLAYWANE